MSVHDQLVADMAVSALMRFHAESGVDYSPADADPVSLTAIVGAITIDAEPDEHGRAQLRRRTLTISVDPSSTWGGIADPAVEDLVTIDGEQWMVESIESLSGSLASLRMVETLRVERSRPGLRK